jgi:hypothetical protein
MHFFILLNQLFAKKRSFWHNQVERITSFEKNLFDLVWLIQTLYFIFDRWSLLIHLEKVQFFSIIKYSNLKDVCHLSLWYVSWHMTINMFSSRSIPWTNQQKIYLITITVFYLIPINSTDNYVQAYTIVSDQYKREYVSCTLHLILIEWEYIFNVCTCVSMWSI